MSPRGKGDAGAKGPAFHRIRLNIRAKKGTRGQNQRQTRASVGMNNQSLLLTHLVFGIVGHVVQCFMSSGEWF